MKRVVAVLLSWWAFSAAAIIPENGWWWASNESGRGFNIEVQDNLVFFASFGYEPNGLPMWLSAGGSMTSDRDFTGPLTKYSSGQCFGCPYVSPIATNAGTLTLRFTSSQTAVLTINGVSISVKRFDFWQNEVVPDGMLGEWSMVIGEAASPTYDGDRIDFFARRTDASGPYLAGYRLGAPGNTAILSFSSGSYQILIDSSPNFYRLYRFNTTGFNRVEGQYWVFDKGASATGPGTFFQGFRTASATFVRTGSGPASTKALRPDVPQDQEARDALAAAKSRTEAPAPEEVVRDLAALKAALIGAKAQ